MPDHIGGFTLSSGTALFREWRLRVTICVRPMDRNDYWRMGRTEEREDQMLTKRGVVTVCACAAAIAVAPVAASEAVLPAEAAPVAALSAPGVSGQAVSEGAADYSQANLAGTGFLFLAVGLGSVTLAHRRRWRDS